ncbi:MAG: ABC transporter permease [Alphaproteobacteria bacterium]
MCSDPDSLDSLTWFLCYFTSGNHQSFYLSFLTVLGLMALATPCILILGFAGALAKRSGIFFVRWFGQIYTSMVRSIPDIIFFLFVPFAMDQGFEYVRHKVLCPESVEPVYQGSDFVVCTAAKLPLGPSPEWVHDMYGFILALIAYSIVFGAFAANVIDGALKAVPKNQIETASAYGFKKHQIFWRIHMPQMWAYALPGLSNLWMILIKATPLLFLLGVEDIVYWARKLGSSKSQIYDFPHPNWLVWYFLALLIFYLLFTAVSEVAFKRLTRRVSRGQASAAGAEGVGGKS